MKSLTEIQAGTRFNAADSRLSLLTDDNLEVTNRNYRALAAELPWPELRIRNTDLTTVAAQAAYDLPSRSIIVYLDLKLVEMQDGEEEDKYKIIPPAPTELEINLADQMPDQEMPWYYVLESDGIDDRIRFVAAPKFGSKTIRMTGIIEPEPLVDGDDRTPFRQRAADDALEHIIAADMFQVDGFTARSNAQLSKAQQILGRLFGRDVVPLERLQQIIQG